MEVTARSTGDVLVVCLTGRLDAETTPQAQKRFDELIGTGTQKAALDFSALEYISSAGLRLVLATARKQPALRVFGLTAVVRQVFDIAGFTGFLNVYETETEALKEF